MRDRSKVVLASSLSSWPPCSRWCREWWSGTTTPCPRGRDHRRPRARSRSIGRLTIVDLHADSLLWGRDLGERSDRGHVDVPRLIEGNVAIEAFTVVTKTPRGLNVLRNDDRSDMITPLAVVQRWPPRTWTQPARARALPGAQAAGHRRPLRGPPHAPPHPRRPRPLPRAPEDAARDHGGPARPGGRARAGGRPRRRGHTVRRRLPHDRPHALLRHGVGGLRARGGEGRPHRARAARSSAGSRSDASCWTSPTPRRARSRTRWPWPRARWWSPTRASRAPATTPATSPTRSCAGWRPREEWSGSGSGALVGAAPSAVRMRPPSRARSGTRRRWPGSITSAWAPTGTARCPCRSTPPASPFSRTRCWRPASRTTRWPR